jgi:hypothetical protein
LLRTSSADAAFAIDLFVFMPDCTYNEERIDVMAAASEREDEADEVYHTMIPPIHDSAF